MDPKLAKRLMEIPEMATFCQWLDEEAAKLNTIAGIVSEVPELVAIEVKARKLAHEKLLDILEPLLGAQHGPRTPVSAEYAIDVDEIDTPH